MDGRTPKVEQLFASGEVMIISRLLSVSEIACCYAHGLDAYRYSVLCE